MRAVNLSGILGCVGLVFVLFIRAPSADLRGFLTLLLYGIPVAVVLSWIVVAPLLAILMRRPISRLRAFVSGAGFAAAVASVLIALGFTAPNWQTNVQNSAMLILGNALVALAVREMIGPGRDV